MQSLAGPLWLKEQQQEAIPEQVALVDEPTLQVPPEQVPFTLRQVSWVKAQDATVVLALMEKVQQQL